MDYTMTYPCDQCPFRNDKPFPLNAGRMQEIIDGASFPCHKTVNYDNESDHSKERHCAGLMILLEKEGMPNQMMRISERLGMYDFNKLDMSAPVYDSIADAVYGIEEA